MRWFKRKPKAPKPDFTYTIKAASHCSRQVWALEANYPAEGWCGPRTFLVDYFDTEEDAQRMIQHLAKGRTVYNVTKQHVLL